MDIIQLIESLYGGQKAQPWANLNPAGTPASPGAQAVSSPQQQSTPQAQGQGQVTVQGQQLNPAMMASMDNMTAPQQAPIQPLMPQMPSMQSPPSMYAPLMPAPNLNLQADGGSGDSIFKKISNGISDFKSLMGGS